MIITSQFRYSHPKINFDKNIESCLRNFIQRVPSETSKTKPYLELDYKKKKLTKKKHVFITMFENQNKARVTVASRSLLKLQCIEFHHSIISVKPIHVPTIIKFFNLSRRACLHTRIACLLGATLTTR